MRLEKSDLMGGSGAAEASGEAADVVEHGNEAQDAAESMGGMSDTIGELNRLLENVNELAENPAVKSMLGQSQGGQAPQSQEGQAHGSGSGVDIDGEQVYEYLTQFVQAAKGDLGADASLVDLEEYVVENKDMIVQIANQQIRDARSQGGQE